MDFFPRVLAFFITLAVAHYASGYNDLEGEVEEKVDYLNLIKWNQLKTYPGILNVINDYAALPAETQQELHKTILRDPSRIAKIGMSMFGPQVGDLISEKLNDFKLGNIANLASLLLTQKFQEEEEEKRRRKERENEIDDYETGENDIVDFNKQKNIPGFDFGPFGTLLGNMVSSNPQMLLDIFQKVTQVNLDGLHDSFSVDSIIAMLTQHLDLDTIIAMLTSIKNTGRNSKTGQEFVDMFKLHEIIKWLREFASSPTGIKVNRMLPRVLKAESLPDALRIIEKEMLNFRFDTILRQIQNPIMRQLIVVQAVRPIGEFLKGVHLPVSELKELVNDADELLNDRMGLGEKTRAFIEPVLEVIKNKFKISKDSLLDLKPKDFEKIAGDVLAKEVLEPMASVWDVYGHAKNHVECSLFVFCQLNKNFYSQNFIQRYVIKTSSVISAFQASATMKDKDSFSQLNQAIRHGGDGYDCTHGIAKFCLDLMHTTAHNEL